MTELCPGCLRQMWGTFALVQIHHKGTEIALEPISLIAAVETLLPSWRLGAVLSAVPRFAGGRHHSEGHQTSDKLSLSCIGPLFGCKSGLLLGSKGLCRTWNPNPPSQKV
jgi:hypothetical protein